LHGCCLLTKPFFAAIKSLLIRHCEELEPVLPLSSPGLTR
jgi:hypothetical protein